MTRQYISPLEQRRAELLSRSTEVLTDLPHSYGTQSFILSEVEASFIGESIHTRNHEAIQEVVGDVISSAVEDYQTTDAAECIGIWNQTFSSIFGDNIVTGDLLANDDTRELLNKVLTESKNTQLGMDTTEYLKLLETVAIMTMPDEGLRKIPESRRSRTGGTERAVFYRTLNLITGLADSEPGIRTVREDILSTDRAALNKYLASLVRARSAQTSLSLIQDMTPHDVRRHKAGLTRTIYEEREHDTDIENMLHVLEWKMLTGREDRETRHKQIKKIIEGQSTTERQKRQLAKDWCPERLDFLIEIAEQAQDDGRNPALYISNRFEEGAGVYVAVELDNPHDPSQKMLFADNPISGNALYIVDEVRLENEGRPNSWEQVLGSNRRKARERGAIRKYHTGDWQGILPKIMSMGEAPAPYVTQPVTPVEPILEANETEALITESETLRKRLDAIMASVRPLIK